MTKSSIGTEDKMSAIDANTLPLQRLYHWERERADAVWLTQPMGGGELRELTWRQGADEVRRVAAYLRAQDWPAGSRIAIQIGRAHV